jgi:hypothetical protein
LRVTRGTRVLPSTEKFDDLTNAVSFVMGLDTSLQATATIRLPGDDAIGLAIIRKMYAAQESRQAKPPLSAV